MWTQVPKSYTVLSFISVWPRKDMKFSVADLVEEGVSDTSDYSEFHPNDKFYNVEK